MDFNADLSTFITGFLDELMLSYTFISSSSQVSDPEPKGPLDFYKHSMMFIIFCIIVDHLCFLCLLFVMLSCLFIAALRSPAGKGLTSWLLFVMSNCEFVTFQCGILGQVWYLIVFES